MGVFDLAADSVTAAEIATGAVGTDEIADGTVGADDLGTDSVGSDEISTGAVGTDEIADGTIAAADLGTGSVNGGAGGVITDGSITADDLGTDSVDSDEIAADAVTASEIATGAVTTDEILDGTITQADISAENVTVSMPPEFPNFTITADGTNNRGTLESDYDAGNNRNYYQWTTRRTAMQDYDLVVQWPIPEDFDAFQATSIEFDYRTNTATDTDNQLDLVSILDTTGSSVAVGGTNTDLASTTWATATATGMDATGTYNAGDFITMTFKLQSTSGDFTQLGNIKFNYTAK